MTWDGTKVVVFIFSNIWQFFRIKIPGTNFSFGSFWMMVLQLTLAAWIIKSNFIKGE